LPTNAAISREACGFSASVEDKTMFSTLLNNHDEPKKAPTLGAIGPAGGGATRSRFFGSVISDSFFGGDLAEEDVMLEDEENIDVAAWEKMQNAAGRMRQSDLTAGSVPFVPSTVGRADPLAPYATPGASDPVGYNFDYAGKNPPSIGAATRRSASSTDEPEGFFDFDAGLDDNRLSMSLEPLESAADPNERQSTPGFNNGVNGVHEAAPHISQAQALYDKSIAAQAALGMATVGPGGSGGALFGGGLGRRGASEALSQQAHHSTTGPPASGEAPPSPDVGDWGHLKEDSIAISKVTLTCDCKDTKSADVVIDP